MKSSRDICPICETDEVATRHHVVPLSRGKKIDVPTRLLYAKDSPMYYFNHCIVKVCMDCGSQVHMLYTNKELEAFGTLEILCEQPDMIKYIEWKKKHPGEHAHKSSLKLREWKKYHRG
jgi:hypothetical protein